MVCGCWLALLQICIFKKRVMTVLLPSSGTHIRVLMFIDSMEVEGLVVDEELGAGNVDHADANW